MSAFFISYLIVIVINVLILFLLLLSENKEIQTSISWFVFLCFFPIIGYFIYLLFGTGLGIKTKKYLIQKQKVSEDYLKYIYWKNQENFDIKQRKKEFTYIKEISSYVNNVTNNMFSIDNVVKVFINGVSAIKDIKYEISNAKHSIHLEYYIFANDRIGNEILELLLIKQKQGVKVKLIYDSFGSAKTSNSFFEELKNLGGEVYEFFPPLLGVKRFNLKINYRNHRKIIVIDGKIGYIGGVNIRDDHMGNNEKLSPWRDTHIKLQGKVVWDLQNVFLSDFYSCNNKKELLKDYVSKGYFYQKFNSLNKGKIGAQIITSGPQDSSPAIYDAYIKMIYMAKKRILIQSPYFIVDEMFIKSLILARQSGVEVCIMIPILSDRKIVKRVSYFYAKKLIKHGIDVFCYKGFIHSKTFLIDNKVISIGSCNIDNRSFKLNFEITALLYDKNFVNKNALLFYNDIKKCKRLELSYFKKRNFFDRFALMIYRLFSNIL